MHYPSDDVNALYRDTPTLLDYTYICKGYEVRAWARSTPVRVHRGCRKHRQKNRRPLMSEESTGKSSAKHGGTDKREELKVFLPNHPNGSACAAPAETAPKSESRLSAENRWLPSKRDSHLAVGFFRPSRPHFNGCALHAHPAPFGRRLPSETFSQRCAEKLSSSSRYQDVHSRLPQPPTFVLRGEEEKTVAPRVLCCLRCGCHVTHCCDQGNYPRKHPHIAQYYVID